MSKGKKWKVSGVIITSLLLYMYKSRIINNKNKKYKEIKKKNNNKKKKKIKIDRQFLNSLYKILKTVCGKREMLTAIILTSTLLARTLLSVWIAKHLGQTVNALCNKLWIPLVHCIVKFGVVTIFGALLNAALKFYSSSLVFQIRQRLTLYIHDLYMKNNDMVYYKANKVGVDKLEHTDQMICADLDKFSETLSDVFSQALKPIVDFVVMSFELSRMQGIHGPLGMYSWFFIATAISTSVLPPFGQLAAKKQQLEGQFRSKHAELIVNCEQIAFLGGNRPEKKILNESFHHIYKHEKSSTIAKLFSNVITGYVNKYFASVIGLLLVTRPIYMNPEAWKTPGDIARYYVNVTRIMAALSDSVLALFELSNRIGRLAGLTFLVQTLVNGLTKRQPVLADKIKQAHENNNPPKFIKGDILKFENVNVYRPDGVLLVKDLNFSVKPGDRVIVCGPNGCGKSSLFRIIRGLWPLVCGTITKPDNKDIYFLSQVNFVPQGTLRELIIYPQTISEMKEANKTDDDLRQVLKWADLEGLAFDGIQPQLSDVRDWRVDLSPGQKQRLAFARLLYHRPKYAVLDECTNGISPSVEQALYDRCRLLGMAVFSISHKLELKKLHDYELEYLDDDSAGYRFTKLNH